MCYALTKSTIVVYDMWMNYEDFTRNRKTNAINAVNGIASEYVRRLDDDPSHHCYREKENSARSSISQVTKDSNVVSVIDRFGQLNLQKIKTCRLRGLWEICRIRSNRDTTSFMYHRVSVRSSCKVSSNLRVTLQAFLCFRKSALFSIQSFWIETGDSISISF